MRFITGAFLLRKTRKTVADPGLNGPGAPGAPEGQRCSFVGWWRAFARFALLSALAVALPFALLAQHAGYGGGHSGSVEAHGAAPGRGYPLGTPRVGTAPLGLHAPAAGYTGIRQGALRSYGVGRNYFRNYRRTPYAYFFAPYYYPFLDYASSPYPDYGYGYDAEDPNAQGALMAENMLGDQINRLSAEVDQMRYGQPPPMAPATSAEQDSQPPAPPVTLVLRNGQQFKVQNYAVMDQTFWDFSAQPTLKIPISNIDVAASAKATMANGGEFPQLDTSARNGQ